MNVEAPTPSRRTLLQGTGLLFGATAFPAIANAAPETKTAKLGYIALTDSAPLIIAKVKGLFAKYGMADVAVIKQASWGGVRDNLELGSGGGGIDGAHILSPMPYFMTLGTITKTRAPVPVSILARLNTNGQGISVEAEYLNVRADLGAAKMKPIIAKRKAAGSASRAAPRCRKIAEFDGIPARQCSTRPTVLRRNKAG